MFVYEAYFNGLKYEARIFRGPLGGMLLEVYHEGTSDEYVMETSKKFRSERDAKRALRTMYRGVKWIERS